MANDGKISTADHLKAMLRSEDMLEHLTKEHGAKNVPVSKASQAKLHGEVHKAEAERVAPPAPGPVTPTEPKTDHDSPIGPLSELDTLKAQIAELKKAQPSKASTFGTPEAKNALFTAAVKVLDELVRDLKDDDPIVKTMGREEAARTVSQAIHHFATGRDATGARVWPATTLPKPQRSSWK